MNEIEKVNAMCFYLINQCLDTNAKTMKIKQENVTHLGKDVGTWEITVKKI